MTPDSLSSIPQAYLYLGAFFVAVWLLFWKIDPMLGGDDYPKTMPSFGPRKRVDGPIGMVLYVFLDALPAVMLGVFLVALFTTMDKVRGLFR